MPLLLVVEGTQERTLDEEVRENKRADHNNNPGFGVWRVCGRGRGDDAGRYRCGMGDVSFGGGSGGGGSGDWSCF